MRSRLDRIRHAVGFEVIGLLLIVSVMSQFGYNAGHVGAMGVFFSVIATVWNYVYNVAFDKMMEKRYGHTRKTTGLRIIHAIIFEFGLLWVTVPVIAWVLKMTLWEAFLMDIGLVLFYLVYAYVYNLAYDHIFPVPESNTATAH